MTDCAAKHAALLALLEQRFAANMSRHPSHQWSEVKQRLLAAPDKLTTIQAMQDTGGEPDVVDFAGNTSQVAFCDCSPESPAGRRSLCFDLAAWTARKANKPTGNVSDMASAMGLQLLNEQQYRHLQTTGAFDLKTSSWIATPEAIRQLGGALFADRRYNQVFVYHNGAESYYAARSFRGTVSL